MQYLNRFEEVLKGIFHFYYYSPKKRRELYDIATSLDQELKHFGGVQQIRWVASQNRALKALLNNYEITCIHLEEIRSHTDENSQKAKGFLKELKTKRFLSFLHFMIDWTELLRKVSELFQQKFSLVAEVKQRIDELKEKYEHMKTRRGKMLRHFQTESANGSFKGVIITHQVQRRGEDENNDVQVERSIDTLLGDSIFFLEERFIKHIGGEPHSLFNVFNLSMWPVAHDELRNFGDEQMESLLTLYAPLLTDEEKDAALDQWLDLKLIIDRNRNRNTLEAYESLMCLEGQDIENVKHILPLVNIMLTISPSTADCERGFSAMNKIKTESRTSMSQDTLKNLMRISIDGPNLNEYNATDSVVHWMNSSRGTRHIHGHKCTGPRGPRARNNNSSNNDSD